MKLLTEWLSPGASDQDDQGKVSFDIGAIEYRVTSSSAEVLKDLPRCNLTAPYLSFQTNWNATANLFDLSHQEEFIRGRKNHNLDLLQKNFAYAITNLKSLDGNCQVLTDAEGFLTIDDNIQWIRIIGKVYDYHGNGTAFDLKLEK